MPTLIYLILGLVSVIGGILMGKKLRDENQTRSNIARLGSEAPTLTEGGHTFRDLNKNGKLDPYEDNRLPIETRVEDLLSQMTLEEKAGLMFHPTLRVGKDGFLVEKTSPYSPVQTSELVSKRLINHFKVYDASSPRQIARWQNRLQKLAERTRLGIPITISSEPLHTTNRSFDAKQISDSLSQWPDPLGLAATGDPEFVQQFGNIARQEYLAMGIRVALHPQADLATEPRWGGIRSTFGEDAELAAKMVAAYIRGFQGDTIGAESVACVTGHFPGSGPQKDGEDAQFSYGKDQVYPGGNFGYHLQPFQAAIAAGTAQIMPSYGRPLGTEFDEVGFGFNQQVITTLLREQLGFDGLVCTDWLLLTGMRNFGRDLLEARCWGVEELSVAERLKKAIEAGCDQLGGEAISHVLVDLVIKGDLRMQRIDESARRILREKFRLGLFDNPYVDEEAAAEICGQVAFRQAADQAQRKSIVLLKNGITHQGLILPMLRKVKLYVENLAPEVARRYGEVVSTPEEAEIAILRLNTPFEPRTSFAERQFHAGKLDFDAEELSRILEICKDVPTIVDIYLERPAVIPEIAEQCTALLTSFGASDTALMDVLYGKFKPTGKLPFELPGSMEAVRNQKEDLPHDSEKPLFKFGYGLTFE
jgi:beta-glucosidase